MDNINFYIQLAEHVVESKEEKKEDVKVEPAKEVKDVAESVPETKVEETKA